MADIKLLKERHEKAIADLNKIKATQSKRFERLEKLEAKSIAINPNMNWQQYYAMTREEQLMQEAWIDVQVKIDVLKMDIKDAERKLKDQQKKIDDYAEKLNKEEAIEKKNNDIPECLKQFKETLIASWDEYDRRKAINVKKAYEEYMAWLKANRPVSMKDRRLKMAECGYDDVSYNYYVRQTEEYRHEQNVKDATRIIMNLVNRIEKKCGVITEWNGLQVVMGNEFEGAALNGWVKGDKGSAEVESILAGGYNIQKLHVRTLVK